MGMMAVHPRGRDTCREGGEREGGGEREREREREREMHGAMDILCG